MRVLGHLFPFLIYILCGSLCLTGVVTHAAVLCFIAVVGGFLGGLMVNSD